MKSARSAVFAVVLTRRAPLLVRALLLLVHPARAQNLEDPYYDPDNPHAEELRRVEVSDRRVSLDGVAGFGTLVGEVGLLGSYALIPRLSLVGGAGIGIDGPLQVGFGARGRVLTSHRTRAQHSLVTGLGMSMGRYGYGETSAVPDRAFHRLFSGMGHDSVCEEPDDYCEPPKDERAVEFARWLQLDAGYELRTVGGLDLFVGGGLAWLTNEGDCELDGAPCADSAQPLLPTFTVAVGYAL